MFGLFGALLVLNRHLGRSSAGIVRDASAINAVLGFVVPGIAWQAHLGGVITGAVLAGADRRDRSPAAAARWQLPALLAVALWSPGRARGRRSTPLSDQTFMHLIPIG